MYLYLICVHPEQAPNISVQTVMFETSETRAKLAIEALSTKYPLSVILIYKLDKMQKLVSPPQYAQYKAMPNGEIVPL